MISYAFVDALGLVTGAGSGPRLPEGALELPEGVAPMASITMMLVEGKFVPRPALAVPVVTASETAGLTILIFDLPDATLATVTDTLIGAELAVLPQVKGRIDIELIDAGSYRIDVEPPRPFVQMIIDIEVPV